MILVFDTETTGKWNKRLPMGHPEQPRLVQIGALLIEPETRRRLMTLDVTIYRDHVPEEASAIHGVTTDFCQRYGVGEEAALDVFLDMVEGADTIVCHNIEFDTKVIKNAIHVLSQKAGADPFAGKGSFCTMLTSVPILKLPPNFPGAGYAWPKLEVAVKLMLDRDPTGAHSAIGDAIDAADLFFRLQDVMTKTLADRAALSDFANDLGQDAVA